MKCRPIQFYAQYYCIIWRGLTLSSFLWRSFLHLVNTPYCPIKPYLEGTKVKATRGNETRAYVERVVVRSV